MPPSVNASSCQALLDESALEVVEDWFDLKPPDGETAASALVGRSVVIHRREIGSVVINMQ